MQVSSPDWEHCCWVAQAPEEDRLPANAEPEVKLRHSITQLDSDVLDSWDFDVFFFTPDQLVAYVALMFMHLGLTTQDVRYLCTHLTSHSDLCIPPLPCRCRCCAKLPCILVMATLLLHIMLQK